MMKIPELTTSQIRNRTSWQSDADWWATPGAANWARSEPVWGIWELPESQLNLLPSDMAGYRCLEIGCGTAYVSAWMARRGGKVVGLDPTAGQLRSAIQFRKKHGLDIHLVEAFGESIPFADSSFDFVISEYGAVLWADPYQWIPEASRVLKRGGRLVTLSNHPLNVITLSELDDVGQTKTLLRSYLDLRSIVWDDDEAVEFYLSHSKWIELFAQNSLVVERLLELGAPKNAKSQYLDWADSEWGQHWPTEEAWVVRKL